MNSKEEDMKAGTITDMILVIQRSTLSSMWMLFPQCYNIKVNAQEDMSCLSLYWRKTTKLCFSGIYDDDPEITTLDRGDFGK